MSFMHMKILGFCPWHKCFQQESLTALFSLSYQTCCLQDRQLSAPFALARFLPSDVVSQG